MYFNRVYKTGDVVKYDDEANLIFVGRKDHLVKSRGYRIELNEIELALNSIPEVKQGVAIAIPDEIIGNRIYAYILTSSDSKLKKQRYFNLLFKNSS